MDVQHAHDLTALPGHRLAAMIAGGETSSAEVTAACLARIRATNDKLNAFVAVYEDEAMAAAEARDRDLRAGAVLGPLHGVPVALKDLCEMEGRVTTCGSRMWRERVSPVTATAVRRLQAAGLVVLGKTHMVEFAYGAWGTNAEMGAPWNPWDLAVQRVPGGSSSGSAVAAAAGMAPLAIGSDTGGSVRLPAGFCGLVGLKTTVGRISNHGIMLLCATLDTVGPMTRSVEDTARMFAILAGPDPADPATLAHPPVALEDLAAIGVEGLRLGVLSAAERDGIDGEMLAAYDEACATLERLGARLAEFHLPDSFAGFLDATANMIATEGYAVNRDWIEDDNQPLDPNVRKRLRAGRGVSAADYLDALERMRAAERQAARGLADFAAVLTPTMLAPATPVAEVDEDAPPPSFFTRAVNYLGLCGLAVPCGFSGKGLPLSLHIIGRPYDEAGVLRIGRSYEAATEWSTRRPDLSPLLGS